MNMMRKNNNQHRNNRNNRGGGGGGGGRRYNNNGGGGNRSGQNEGQNLQRQKHHATQQLGKYTDLARNAQINGDRVDVEYYLQHVDHYTRVLTDIAAIEAERYAHTREAQAPQAQEAPISQSAESSGDDNSGNANPAGESSAEGTDFEQNNQPRMPRQHRRPYQQPNDNGAAEANRNHSEIPLPGSILPPI